MTSSMDKLLMMVKVIRFIKVLLCVNVLSKDFLGVLITQKKM